MTKFDKLQMKETETIDGFAGKISEIASKSSSLGKTMDEPKLVKKFLQSLPPDKYIHIVASLEQVLDLNTTAFEDIVGRLKTYEERILGSKSQSKTDEQETVLFSNSDENKGRGQKKNNDELNKSETGTADAALYMHEVVFLNEGKVMPKKYETTKKEEGVWYLDNGASNHMTGENSYFSGLNMNIKGKVKFGDGSHVGINSKGSILFEAKTGEQKLLTDVY
ncbi:uncharacterized protein [Spinacia oleracea]|uniref:Retrovirus-related Pol polyprotein from transposon TNT 1-94-like beta-barrel domain-containing protein n=1 Tax=Spinacia oleracea TaxID=3562 RepID=A0A9R0HTY8_SPIOL|nr:uncharacterized protein LOC110776736 [Spinacia oleracea]